MRQNINRRHFPRVEYPCKIIVLNSGEKETISSHTENLGVGGICVSLFKELPKFCPAEVLLYLDPEQPPLESSARVIWSAKKKKTFNTGIEFIDIKETDRLRIEQIVQKCLNRK